MSFNPEAPRTEDRDFHPNQEKINQISQDLESMIQSADNKETPDNEYWQETYNRSLETLEEQIRQLREKLG